MRVDAKCWLGRSGPDATTTVVCPSGKSVRNIRMSIILSWPRLLSLIEGTSRCIESVLKVADCLLCDLAAAKFDLGWRTHRLVKRVLDHTSLSQLLFLEGNTRIRSDQLLLQTEHFGCIYFLLYNPLTSRHTSRRCDLARVQLRSQRRRRR